ncbi:M48 family metallopeptidase [Spirosoma aerolatum]|uniref:M48 family metallopeptidase n=1 Tax=Spirosoma aerolatum TaxID=1211326 RepID=UPI0009AC037A|nr:M48 family metallopeptidase [Spirosoma aerolatum]
MKRITKLIFWLLSLPLITQAQIRLDSNLVKAGMALLGSATLSDAQVADYSRQAMVQMDAQNPVAGPTDPYTVRLNRIVKRHHTISGIPLNYKVYKVKDVNAFATADGSVRVFQGLMDIMTDTELLAVMGHEIGHVANHDVRDAMKRSLQQSAIRNVASANSGVIGKVSRSQLGDVADYLVGASFSRKQETEADDYSYSFLKRNGYSVLALATSFEKLAKLSGGGQGGKVATIMSSHPDSKARAQRVRDRARREGLVR